MNKRPEGGEVYHIGKRERKPIPTIVDDATRHKGSRLLYDWQMDFVNDMKISANLATHGSHWGLLPRLSDFAACSQNTNDFAIRGSLQKQLMGQSIV